MRINYIQQIRAFYDSLLTKSLSAGQIALWHALMHVNNKCTWIEWFTVSNGVLESLTGLSRGGIEKARNTLKQLGYIDFKSNGKKATSYKITVLSSNSIQESVQERSETVYKEEAKEKQDSIQNSRTLNKLNKTKLNSKEKDKKESANAFSIFEQAWSLYPVKKNKSAVNKKSIAELEKLGLDSITLAINNYLQDVDNQRVNGFEQLNYMNGGTFFNGRYKDYLSADSITPVKKTMKKTKFHNFTGASDKYTDKELDNVARRIREERTKRD